MGTTYSGPDRVTLLVSTGGNGFHSTRKVTVGHLNRGRRTLLDWDVDRPGVRFPTLVLDETSPVPGKYTGPSSCSWLTPRVERDLWFWVRVHSRCSSEGHGVGRRELDKTLSTSVPSPYSGTSVPPALSPFLPLFSTNLGVVQVRKQKTAKCETQDLSKWWVSERGVQ